MNFNHGFRWLAFVVLLSVCPTIAAQQTDTSNEEQEASLNNSPRDAVRGILAAISAQSSESLSDNFDTRNTSQTRNIDIDNVIATFPTLLDKHGMLYPVGVLSNDASGSEEANLSSNFEAIGEIKIKDRKISLILERVEVSSGEKRWLISQKTIIALAGVAPAATTSIINQMLPPILMAHSWRGAPVGQWLTMLVIAVLSILAAWIVVLAMRSLAVAYQRKYPNTKKSSVISALAVPVGMVAGVFVFLWIERYLGISILIRQDFSLITMSVLWIALFIFLWSLMDSLSAHGEQLLREKNRAGSLSLFIFFRATAKVILFLLAIILVLDSNGVDVTTGLAALGIGGIALALGAQKAIENIVGSVIIVIDQPFRVGDFCRVGDMLGTIENIGLRSTRIRTLADTLVTFPNGVLSSERIENYTMRRKFLLRTVLNLRYETKTQDMQNLLTAMQHTLETTSYIDPEGLRVRFIGYGATSLDVEIFAYVTADNYAQFLERQEETLLKLSHIVESNGSGFAFPSQTLYLTRDKKPDSSVQ